MGIKKNFAYNSILTISGYIFPLLTFPYVSRVLGVTNVGICNFMDSVINYFILFSMMGIGVTGIREVAKNKNDRKSLSNVFSSLLTLNAIATIIILIILILVTCFVPKLREHWQLMCVGGVKVLFNLFLIEWFFKGLEEFRYITIRSLIIKVSFVLSVFIFVRKADDYKIYFTLMCLLVVVNAICNWFYRRKFILFDIHNITLKNYYKPFLMIGTYMLLTSMYTSFNVAFLGFVGGETEVGYYTTATKLYTIILSLFTAFTSVMLPRMSALVSEGNIERVKNLTSKSFDILFCFSFPLIIWSVIFAPEIIRILAGTGYEGAILPMRIVVPLVLIIGLEQILVLQILMPFRADKYILINSIIGALVGIIANLLLVNRFLSVGSSIVWILSECAVLISAAYFVWKLIRIKLPVKSFIVNFVYGIAFFVICLVIRYYIANYWGMVISAFICGVLALALQIFISKNTLVINIIRLRNKEK